MREVSNKTKETPNFWEKEELVNIVPNSTGKSVIKSKVVEKEGKKFVDIRKFVNKKGTTEGFEQHTSDGISVDVANIDALIATLQRAKEILQAEGRTEVQANRTKATVVSINKNKKGGR